MVLVRVRVQLYSHRSGREGVTRFFIHSGLNRFTDPPEDSQQQCHSALEGPKLFLSSVCDDEASRGISLEKNFLIICP
jgi:hypothetical protein